MIGAVRIFLAMMLGAALFAAPVPPKPDTADTATVQPDAPQPIERGTLRLHYVQKPIGYERYEVASDGDLSRQSANGAEGEAGKLTADFDFTERGGRVHLAATLRAQADLTPISFQPQGQSYRFVNVDSDVRV